MIPIGRSPTPPLPPSPPPLSLFLDALGIIFTIHALRHFVSVESNLIRCRSIEERYSRYFLAKNIPPEYFQIYISVKVHFFFNVN